MSRTELEEARMAEGLNPDGSFPGSEAESVAERAENGHTIAPDAQEGMFDQVIENDVLERALEEREKTRASKAAVTAKHKEADDKAKGIIATLELEPDTTVRVGRFRLKYSSVEGRSVSFDTAPTNRLTISLLGD